MRSASFVEAMVRLSAGCHIDEGNTLSMYMREYTVMRAPAVPSRDHRGFRILLS